MHSSSTLQPRVDSGLLDAPCRPRSGEVGRIAAASSRRGEAGRKALSTVAVATPKDRTSAFGPAVWLVATIAAWSLLVGGRTQIVRVAPATAPIYAGLGLNVNLRQMEIEGVVSKLSEEEGRTILVVEGEIRNLADAARAAPRMRLAVLDAAGREIYFWTAAPPKSRLASGEKAVFRARLAAPPQGGRQVQVRFAGAPDQAGHGT